MGEPTQSQIDAARTLGVSLYFSETPTTLARIVEIIADLQKRIEILESKKSWLR
jgi:hypothetical protein